jgi:hypothetical protein
LPQSQHHSGSDDVDRSGVDLPVPLHRAFETRLDTPKDFD